jgi:hypothetical protein
LLAWADGVVNSGLDPEDVCDMFEAADRRVFITWPASNRPDRFDAEVNGTIEDTANPIDVDDPRRLAVRANRPSLRAHRDSLEIDLRLYLADRLPAYMIPSRFVWHDQLPVDERGKLNRSALAAVEPTARAPLPTLTAIERLVRQAWAGELDEHPADRTANFFELGGTSLGAVRVAAKLGSSLGVFLPAHLIFENMTVRSLSSEILARIERDQPGRSENSQ